MDKMTFNERENRVFIIFVCNSIWKYEQNEAIAKLYMNRIAVDEDDQLEIAKVVAVEQDRTHRLSRDSIQAIRKIFNVFNAQVAMSKFPNEFNSVNKGLLIITYYIG